MPPAPNNLTSFSLTFSATGANDSSVRAGDGIRASSPASASKHGRKSSFFTGYILFHRRAARRKPAVEDRHTRRAYAAPLASSSLQLRAQDRQIAVLLAAAADMHLPRQPSSAADVLVIRQADLAGV